VAVVPFTVCILLGYLLGSIPTGYLVARARGVDIRTVGSGNIGATNVFRILGKPAGILVLTVDALKGFASSSWVADAVWHAFQSGADSRQAIAVAGGLASVLGHNYTCWLNFKGGKGIATSAGVLAGLVPWSCGIVLMVWLLVFAASRYVSLASICAAATLPLAVWLTHGSRMMIGVTGAMGALAIYKHKANIQRLLNGTENRIGGKKPESSE
jgi:glycerol-3-phosphate acyltransferase PlsY